jgi:hypothetical protein
MLIRNTRRHPVQEVEVDQAAGEDRARDGRDADDRAEQRVDLRQLLLREDLVEHAEPLGDQDRAEAALKDAAGDEDLGARR